MPRRKLSRAERQAVYDEARRWPPHLVQIPLADITQAKPPGLVEVWRSSRYLVQVFQHGPHVCVSACRTSIGPDHARWRDGIRWDDLQEIKRQIGRGEEWAVEVFPPDQHLVNVANMRHLWIVSGDVLPFAWRRQ